MLLSPVVRLTPAPFPNPMLPPPVLTFWSANTPSAVFWLPVLCKSAWRPIPVLPVPVTLEKSAPPPTAVLLSAVALLKSAAPPMAVLKWPVVSQKRVESPAAVLNAPVLPPMVVLLKSAWVTDRRVLSASAISKECLSSDRCVSVSSGII